MATSRLRDCFMNGSHRLDVEEIIKTYHAVFRDAFYAKDFIPTIANRLQNEGLGTHANFIEIENYLFENLLPQGFYSPLMVVKIFTHKYDKVPLFTENQNNILKAEETVWEELYQAHKPTKASAKSF